MSRKMKCWVMAIVVCTGLLAHAQVYRDRVKPHWFDHNNQFWCRLDLAGGTQEFIRVNAVTGTRQPAFDHARLARVLSEKTGKTITADKLPFESLSFSADGKSVGLAGGATAWRLNLADYSVTEVNDLEAGGVGLPFDLNPRPSVRTGDQTTVIFVNRLKIPVKLYWMSNGGTKMPYGTLAPGQRRSQHTYAGHVWTVTDPNDKVLAVFEAPEQGGLAVIDGRTPDRQHRRGRRGPRRRRGARRLAENVPSPDGQWIAFVKDQNLWLRSVQSGVETALTTDGNEADSYHKDTYRDRAVEMNYNAPNAPATLPSVIWSPDSKSLIALKTRKVPARTVYEVESSPPDQLQPKLESYPYLKPGDAIPVGIPHLFSVQSDREIPLAHPEWFAHPWNIDRYEWMPDSKSFTFLYNQRGHQVMRVLSVDAATGAMRKLVEETSKTFIDYSDKTYLKILPQTHELIWMSERSGWNHLYRVDMNTGKIKNPITEGHWVVRSVERVDSKTRRIWFRAMGAVPGQDPYWIQYGRVNFDGSGLIWLTAGAGTHFIDWSPDRRFLIDTYSRVNVPPRIVLRDQNGKLMCPLEKADDSELLATGRQLPEPFVAKGRDGVTDIYGVIHRPLHFDPNKHYPVIENIYAGPQGAFVPKGFRASYREWSLADMGFIVVQIDGMGTNWRSRAFHDICWKNLGDAGLPDRILWIKTAAKKYPYMDLSHVGIYGVSAGAQSSLEALLTHGDFYKVGVSDCGCHDNRMDKIWWNEQWMGYPVGPQYAAQSNVTLAHNLKGDLFLMVGELDHNVDPSSTMQVVNALIKANKDFDMLVVPGSDHGASSSPYGWHRLCEFFVKHLKP